MRKRPCVLIAEDDPAVAAMLIEAVAVLGYEVSMMESLERTVDAATDVRPDIILIGLDGRGAFEPGWRAAALLSHLLPGSPMVMIATSDAAVAEVGHTPRGRAFNAALLKPFHLDQLTTILDRLRPSHDVPIVEEAVLPVPLVAGDSFASGASNQ